MTKTDLQRENAELRALLAKTCADHDAEKKALERKLFQAHAQRSRLADHLTQRQVGVPARVARMVAAREEAMRTNRCVAV